VPGLAFFYFRASGRHDEPVEVAPGQAVQDLFPIPGHARCAAHEVGVLQSRLLTRLQRSLALLAWPLCWAWLSLARGWLRPGYGRLRLA